MFSYDYPIARVRLIEETIEKFPNPELLHDVDSKRHMYYYHCAFVFQTYTDLSRIRGVVLEDLDGDNLVGALLPALDHLAEGAPSEELEHLILVGHGVEHLVLHQLVVPIGAAPRPCFKHDHILTVHPGCPRTRRHHTTCSHAPIESFGEFSFIEPEPLLYRGEKDGPQD